jgi:hypothetical protein
MSSGTGGTVRGIHESKILYRVPAIYESSRDERVNDCWPEQVSIPNLSVQFSFPAWPHRRTLMTHVCRTLMTHVLQREAN